MLTGTGTVYYRPEEVLIGAPDQSSPPALHCQTRVLDVLRTLPVARVRLRTNPPITALMLHRDLQRLPQSASIDVEVTLPPHAIRVIQTTRNTTNTDTDLNSAASHRRR